MSFYYLLAKIGVDTAENEPEVRIYNDTCTSYSEYRVRKTLRFGGARVVGVAEEVGEGRHEPGGSVRGERANFTRLVLGCIEAKFCKT